jgi:hypothetical protein
MGPVSKTLNMHVVIIEHFPIFSSFVNQIEQFFVSLDVQTGILQMLFEVRSKESTPKT